MFNSVKAGVVMLSVKVLFERCFFFGKQGEECTQKSFVLADLLFAETFFKREAGVSGVDFGLVKNFAAIFSELKKNLAFISGIFVGKTSDKTFFFERVETLAEVGFETADGDEQGAVCHR